MTRGSSGSRAKLSIVPEEARPLVVSVFSTLDSRPLGKVRGLDGEGKLRKSSRAAFSNGRVQQISCPTLMTLLKTVGDMGADQALGFGVCDFVSARLVTKERLARGGLEGPVVARTKSCFNFRSAPGVLHGDYDPLPGSTPLSPTEVVGLIRNAAPELKGVTIGCKPSSSSHLTHPNGTKLAGTSGAHILLPVMDASRIPEFGRILADRLWLAGSGFVKITGAGLLVHTTILDQSVLSPERLCFVRATCEDGVTQNFPPFEFHPGEFDELLGGESWLDDLTPLTPDERKRVAELQQAARAAAQPEADRVRQAWAERQADRRIAMPGYDAAGPDRAALIQSFVQSGELVMAADLVLYPENGEFVTAAEVFCNPAQWHEVRFADPFEPDYGNDDPRIARAILDRGEPYIESFAHGGLTYYFRSEEARIAAGLLDFADLWVANDRAHRRFEAIPAGEFMRGPPLKWLVRGLLPKAKLGVIYGSPGTGKSFWALDLAASLALGSPWNSIPTKQADVVYICAEGVSAFRKRVEAYQTHHEIDFGSALRIIGDQPDLLNGGDIKTLLAELDKAQPELVIIDTLMQVMPGGDENSGVDMGNVLKACGQIHERTGAMVLIVHHAGKDPTKGARGFSGLRGAADVEVCITNGAVTKVASITKMKDGEDDATYPFRLCQVSLPPCEGEAVNSCIVEHVERTGAAKRPAEPKGINQKAVFSAALDLDPMGDSGVVPADILDRAMDSIPFDRGSDPTLPKRDQRRQNLKRALDILCAAGELFLKDGLIFIYDPDASKASNASDEASE